MTLEVFAIKATKKRGKFDIYTEIKKLIKKNGITGQYYGAKCGY